LLGLAQEEWTYHPVTGWPGGFDFDTADGWRRVSGCIRAAIAGAGVAPAAAAASLVGENNVKRDLLPSMAAEDFACFLESKPGAYIWIGNGNAEGAGMLHSPHYDFNDAILPLGASYWVRLAESILSKDQAAVGQP
jgi:hypothetical protein